MIRISKKANVLTLTPFNTFSTFPTQDEDRYSEIGFVRFDLVAIFSYRKLYWLFLAPLTFVQAKVGRLNLLSAVLF